MSEKTVLFGDELSLFSTARNGPTQYPAVSSQSESRNIATNLLPYLLNVSFRIVPCCVLFT